MRGSPPSAAARRPRHRASVHPTRCTDVRVIPTAATVNVEVDATGNWWGRPEGPAERSEECPATVGAVTTSPWLSEPPS